LTQDESLGIANHGEMEKACRKTRPSLDKTSLKSLATL
jgi:hypothetical protein